LRDGVRVAIVGSTNVGKSSLMNTLVQRDLSIVTDINGTTRDVIESTIDINGFPVVIMDTAGLQKSDDIVETEGINRAKKCAQLADIIIIVIDGEIMENYFGEKQINLDDYRRAYLQQLELNIVKNQRLITIVNKADLMSDEARRQLDDVLVISCTKSIKITDVIDEITSHLQELCGNPSAECPYLSQERHRFYIQECLESIEEFLDKFNPHAADQDLAILVQTIRDSVRSLGRITGEVRTDDILDVIFRDFCIGK
jgi:tRNA modification GTPase